MSLKIGINKMDDDTRILHNSPLKTTELVSGDELSRYKIEKFLGRGGMGTVYQAFDPILKRSVALKLLNTEFAQQESFVKRFDREAENLAKLNHEGVVKVLDRGFDRGWPFLVMELVEGSSLRQEMNSGKMYLDRALSLVRDLAETLKYSHSCGVVHRDIKPENILIEVDGHKPKLTDFGLSKALQTHVVETQITMTNIVMGTLDYMAPEQRRNKGEVNYQSDLYSLGVVFYEMLTGNLPVGAFELPSKEVGSPEWVDKIIVKLLATDTHKRYSSASDLLLDLNEKRSPDIKNDEFDNLSASLGFNWIGFIQGLLVLLMIFMSLPFSWMIIGAGLLEGIQSYQKEQNKIVNNEIKKEERVPRFLKLSMEYWMGLIAMVFITNPHQDNWQLVEKYISAADSTVALKRSTVSGWVDSKMQWMSEGISSVLQGNYLFLSLIMGILIAMMCFLFFRFKKTKPTVEERYENPSANRQPPPLPVEKIKLPGLYRDVSDAWLGGVCSGLAHKLNLSVGGFRFLVFISIFIFFVPILAYIIAWIIMPGYHVKKYQEPESAVARKKGKAGGCLIVTLVVVAALFVFMLLL